MIKGSFTDSYGNTLRLTDTGQLSLKLKSDKHTRHVGSFIDGEYSKWENKEGVFKKLNAFGFCNDIMTFLAPELISVHYKGHRYIIGRERFTKYKQFLNFKKQGMELRTYVPLKYFKRRSV